jgi:hypothetical protein
VARDSVQSPANAPGLGSGGQGGGSGMAEPRNASDARAAFDNLFRKPE